MTKGKLTQAINWNAIEDQIDKATWDKLVEQFWIGERIPVSNDISDWDSLSDDEKDLFNKVFGGLTLLDTMQGEIGNNEIAKDSRNQHELAVFRNIAFMECLTTGHSLLTPKGWVDVSDVKKGDQVLQYNEDGTTEFAPVVETSSHVPETLYHFETDKFDLKVSGGHRMPYQKASINTPFKEWKLSEMTAKEYMVTPQSALKRHILQTSQSKISYGNKMSKEDELFIAIKQNGYLKEVKDWKNNSVNLISILLKTEKEMKDFTSIIYSLDLKYSEMMTFDESKKKLWKIFKTEPHRDGSQSLTITVPDTFVNWGTPERNFDEYFQNNIFSQRNADLFILNLAKWKNPLEYNLENAVTYKTYNESDFEFVKAVGVLSSYYFTFSDSVNEDTGRKEYTIRFTKNESDGFYSFNSKTVKETITPEMVYGIEVPSTYLVVKTSKGMVVTGNCVHAKSYSTIFSTLSTPKEIDEIFKWTAENKYIISKAEIIQDIYENGTPLQKKVASVFLESFLFYSGFFTPLYYAGVGKMKNTAEIIKLILRDESVHGALA